VTVGRGNVYEVEVVGWLASSCRWLTGKYVKDGFFLFIAGLGFSSGCFDNHVPASVTNELGFAGFYGNDFFAFRTLGFLRYFIENNFCLVDGDKAHTQEHERKLAFFPRGGHLVELGISFVELFLGDQIFPYGEFAEKDIACSGHN